MDVQFAPHCSFRIRYHMVFVIKYRRNIISDNVFQFLKSVLEEITYRYYLNFHAVGHENNHLHLLIEARPRYSPSKIMQICKSILSRQIFEHFPEIKDELWGGHLWTEGGHIDTVGDGYGEEKMKEYIRNQGRDHTQLKLIRF